MGSVKNNWVNAALLNLCIVALLGFILRTKILFPIDFIDYRNILTGHGNFALSGWIGFALMCLMREFLLPESLSGKKIYRFVLALVFIFAWCMMLGFALAGPARISIIFNMLLILSTYAFALVFIKDILSTGLHKTIKLLVVISLVSLVLASSGSIALALMYMGAWQIPVSYRDASYIFLHFQYNGFISLGIGAVFLQYLFKQTYNIPLSLQRAACWIAMATIPSVFLSLLYYEKPSFYVIGGITGLMLLIGAFYFIRYLVSHQPKVKYQFAWAKAFWILAAFSFILKMIMQVGTLTPIGHEVYSDRPVIIGFLHMVFLAFASLFILGMLIEQGFFSRNGKLYTIPFMVFIAGVFTNEAILMIQGIEILLKTNNPVYNWLLWIASILLFSGALLIALARILAAAKDQK